MGFPLDLCLVSLAMIDAQDFGLGGELTLPNRDSLRNRHLEILEGAPALVAHPSTMVAHFHDSL